MATIDTIEKYLRSKVIGYEITDEAIAGILYDYGVAEGTPPNELSTDTDENTKIRELMYADVLDVCANMPSSRNSSKEADGQWSSENGGWQRSAYDSRLLRAKAEAIRKKYGITSSTSGGGIKLSSIGVRENLI
jgi:hypothetical protein